MNFSGSRGALTRASAARGRLARFAGLILLVALAWRLILAAAMPALSRDGVVFCWYAQGLHVVGAPYLRQPEAQQHPLYPALLAAAFSIARAVGADDAPLTWQRCGQAVSLVAGLGVVLMSGVLARSLVRRLALPLDADGCGLAAMTLAAMLDQNTWLSADVMSDQPHLALYLAAIWAAMTPTASAALACGGLSGLAFLTRPEGAAPAVAAALAALLSARRRGWRAAGVRVLATMFAFTALTAPYWAYVGRFSTKKDPLDLLREESATARALDPAATASALTTDLASTAPRALAKLETFDMSLVDALPHAAYIVLRAGRVIVPLLALMPLWNLRRRLFEPAMAPLVLCVGLHFAAVVALLDRHGYIAARHALPVVALMIPFAAMLLGRLVQLSLERRAWAPAVAAVGAVVVPAIYAARVPNAGDAHLRAAADSLISRGPHAPTDTLVSGASGKRIAFYTRLLWTPWPETPGDVDGLRRQLATPDVKYFAIETGDGYEFRGNAALVDELLHNPSGEPTLSPVFDRPIRGDDRFYIFEIGG